MAKQKIHPRVEVILKNHNTMMDKLAKDAEKIAGGYYAFRNDHDKGKPWGARSRLSLWVSYVDNQLRISWRTVKFFPNRKGKFQRTVKHIKRGINSTRYEDYLLKPLARDWERPTVMRIERQMEQIRMQVMILNDLKSKIYMYSRARFKFDATNNE